ncbi:uncharacterized protein LOC131225499 isoform X2 [Magnolia sinica]|uniref:uncharacterized protein LOC131225499 isoform X2 n=2 Tax=Magnolia sinica TaxID=86752 RepID=UPI002658D707|nr:uncharacterized protein LOC131225499 isoform X2 [Magnolia sinica]
MQGKNGNINDSTPSLSKISDPGGILVTVDLVPAARRHISFLTAIADSSWLHHTPTLLQAIRRYEEFWMPLIFNLSDGLSKPPMLWPPIDIEWVWYCHCLNPVNYRKYCRSRFLKLIEKPAIFDDENEEYALIRCREIWTIRYPSEPFDLEPVSDTFDPNVADTGLLEMVIKCGSLYLKFSEPFMSETVYLIAAKHRYKRFLSVLERYRDENTTRLVPTCDIHLMWMTHMSFPCRYEEDLKEMEGDLERVVGGLEGVKKEEVEETKKLWERTFDQPYERAGATFDWISSKKWPISWDVLDADVNSKYKALEPRFLLEVCIFVKGRWTGKEVTDPKTTFLRCRTVRSHRELKIDKPILDISSETWRKTWHLYCEFGTRGVVLEIRQRGGCLGRSKMQKMIVFLWNDLLRATSLIVVREVEWDMKALVSITPPVQAPYLLKCVPDRVTDDTGAMISDVILRMNQYRPQEGRWLSRTVLDHAGRECFVIRIRVGGGFWRRGGETPAAVRWEDRIIEIREGSWSYVAGSVGTAPEKIVGTATPKEEDSREKKATWCLSTGDVLTICWEEGLSFELENGCSDESVRLLLGRKLQYQVKEAESGHEEDDCDEDGFITLVRSTPENPNGRATALLNWRLFAVEFSPEEDAVLVLLLCMAIIRTVSEVRREDVGRLLVRRREKEAKLGRRDWGSVMLHPCCCSSSSSSSVHLRPWYWNAKEVLTSTEVDHLRQSNYSYSPADGGDGLYKRGIMP